MLTEQAQADLGSFVEQADQMTLVITCNNAFDEQESLTITPDDVAKYYATEARNLTSGCRTLAGMTGDWRPIDELASLALEWFKQVNIKMMREAALRLGLVPKW